ncbi:hypothetical protein [Streptomyces decoyicus]
MTTAPETNINSHSGKTIVSFTVGAIASSSVRPARRRRCVD